jgi:hypothetical protein
MRSEGLGDATPMQLGEHAENGFEALALYDQPGFDGNGNRHSLQGGYLRKVTDNGPVEIQELQMHDVFFKILHDD